MKMPPIRIWRVDLERSQSAWTCAVTFTCTTHRQFTDEQQSVIASAPHGFLSMLRAYLRARRLAWRVARNLWLVPGGHHNPQGVEIARKLAPAASEGAPSPATGDET